ncbi:MAG TPA: glycosyltransferase [Gemmatimonadaceae bacterium]|nr:glycosyltransferase [Gemmatimonadaceae bacterium]
MTAPPSAAVDVSVIVCTRNRSDALARLLDRLEQLVVPAGVRWELIVVDNGSTDGTAALLASWPRTLPMRVLNEVTPGLSRARNAGLAAASGGLLLFTDDDCLPDPQWLAAIRDEFARAPSLGVLGGRVELFDQRDQPTTTRTSRERGQITGAFNLDSIIGCNLALRPSALAAAGPFDIALGGGTGAGAGEDVDFVYRALRAGLRIEYSPDALVYHNHGRRTDAQVRALTRAYTVARGAIFCKYLLQRDRGILPRIHQDVRWHSRALMQDLRAARFPSRAVRHYYQLAIGAAYWIRHRLTEWRAPASRRDRQPTGGTGS